MDNLKSALLTILGIALAVSSFSPRIAMAAGPVSETFDTFTCPGAWEPTTTPNAPNTSYIRDCGNGWTAYAEDNGNPATDPAASGPIGNQNVVVRNDTDGQPAPSVQINTAPDDSVRGVLWLLKTYAVPPEKLQSISADFRIKTSASSAEEIDVVVFDGTVGPNTVLPTDLASGGFGGLTILAQDEQAAPLTCGNNTWCPWQTADFTVFPEQSSVTIAFRMTDIRNTQTVYAELDNLSLSNVSGVAPAPAIQEGDIAQLWSRVYEAAPSAAEDANGEDITVDGSGNLYVTGRSYNGSNYDIVTIKYDTDGNQQWLQTFDGGDVDEGVGIKVDGSGNVYVVGRSHNGTDYDYTVIKYDSTGSQLWAVSYDNAGKNETPAAARAFDNNPTDRTAQGRPLALDASGNVHVTGKSCTTPFDCDYATVKFNTGDGSVAWSRLFDSGGDDQAVGIVLDGSANAHVTGRSANDVITVKYDASGTQLWSATFNSGTNDTAADIGLDGSGNVYVAGMSFDAFTATGPRNFKVIKYNASGAEQWAIKYDSGGEDLPAALAVDSSGNVFVTGKSGFVDDYNLSTIRVNPNGAIAWTSSIGNADFEDTGLDIAVNNGDVYVAGFLERSSGNKDIIVVKHDVSGSATNALTFDGSSFNDIPASIALGTDGLGTTAHVTGASGTASLNVLATVKYGVAHPDLTITDVSAPQSGLVNGQITMSDTVLNISDLAARKAADAGTFDVGYYLAPDVGGSPDLNNLTFLGARTLASLDEGDTDSGSAVVTIPSGVADGDYFPVAIADYSDAILEIDETNNTLAGTVTISVQDVPDLIGTAVSGPAGAEPGTEITLNFTVENTRPPVAGSFDVDFVLSLDSTIGNGDDIALGSKQVNGLGGNSSFSGTADVIIPASTANDDYFYGMVVDSKDEVFELNETNNTYAGVTPVNIAGTAKPDLIISDVTGPASAARGDTVSVSTTVENRLPTDATSSFRVGIYLSTDTTITTGDTFIGSRSVASLSGNTSDTASTSVTIPTGISAGTYYFGAIADDLDAIVEADETNNAAVQGGTGFSTSLSTDTELALSTNISQTQTTTADFGGGTNTDTAVSGGSVKLASTSSGPVWTANSAWNVPDTGGARAKPDYADLDGDGDFDLMIGDHTGVMHGYENTGSDSSPNWVKNTAWSVTVAGRSMADAALADLDGDGDVDLMAGTRFNNIRAYENTGTTSAPVWTANTAWDAPDPGSQFHSAALADLDNDGDFDLLSGRLDGTTLAYENTGTSAAPAWTRNATWDPAGVSGYASPGFADVDGDNDIDLFIGDNNGFVSAFENTGSASAPTWTANSGWDLGIDVGSYAGPTLPDADGDGDPDMVVGENAGISKSYRNDSSGAAFASSGTFRSAVIDVDGHNGFTTLDYTVTTPAGTSITIDVRAGNTATPDGTWTAWQTNIADGGDISVLGTNSYFQYRANLSTTDTSVTPSLDSITVHYDNLPFGTDVTVIGIGEDASVRLAITTPAVVSWAANSAWDRAPVSSYTRARPALGDLDADGDLDLLVGSQGAISYAFENTGDNTSPIWTQRSSWNIPQITGVGNATPALADLDDDGDLDALVGTSNGTTRAYENTGSVTSPAWTARPAWNLPTVGTFTAPALADLDHDGDYDVILGKRFDELRGYENTGTPGSPAWTARPSWNTPVVGSQFHVPTLGDLNGDAIIDLMVGRNDGNNTAYQNMGNSIPVWTAKPSWDGPALGGSTNTAPVFGDLNNDGVLDLLIGKTDGVTLGYENTGNLLVFASSGTYLSDIVDAGNHSGFTTLDYTLTQPGGTAVTIDVRAGNTDTPDGTWTAWMTDIADEGDISSLGTRRYIQYRANLSTTNPQRSPSLDDIVANTQGAVGDPEQTTISLLRSSSNLNSSSNSSGSGALGLIELLLGLGGAACTVIRRARRPRT